MTIGRRTLAGVFPVVLVAAGLSVAGGPFPGSVLAADARAQALFDLYDRGEDDAVDRDLASAKDALSDWRDFEREAAIFVQASPDPALVERRRLVAASVGLELAYVHRGSWNRARALMEAGCRVLQPPQQSPQPSQAPPPPLPPERWWHLAAASLAQSVGDYRFLLPDDMGPPQQALARRPAPSAQWLNHGQHAVMRFGDEPGLKLALGIALETEGLSAMTPEDLPMWVPAERVDRMMTAKTPMLPPNARMDVDSALKLLKLRRDGTPQPAAEKSMRLWTIAARLREAIAGPDVAPEAYMRLGHTFLRLAQPEGALVEFGRAERAGTTPFGRYLARYFGGVALERLDRRPEAMQAYRGALDSVPRAQSATLALTSALFQRGDRDEAVDLVQRSLTTPLANDPLKYDKAGNATEQFTARRAQLRRALR